MKLPGACKWSVLVNDTVAAGAHTDQNGVTQLCLSQMGAQLYTRLPIGSIYVVLNEACTYHWQENISYFTIKPFANQDIFANFISINTAKENKLEKLTVLQVK